MSSKIEFTIFAGLASLPSYLLASNVFGINVSTGLGQVLMLVFAILFPLSAVVGIIRLLTVLSQFHKNFVLAVKSNLLLLLNFFVSVVSVIWWVFYGAAT